MDKLASFSKKKNIGSDAIKEGYRPSKDVSIKLVSNERYVPLTNKSTKETFPVSQFKIPLPKTKPNPDGNFCCIYFDGTKWEKNKRSKPKTNSNKRSSATSSQRNSMDKDKEEKINEDKLSKETLSPKQSRYKINVKGKKSRRVMISDYLRKKPLVKNKEIQTECLELTKYKPGSVSAMKDSSSALLRKLNNTKSELLRKLELHKRELEQKYSAVKVQDLIKRLQNNQHINENVLCFIKNQKIPNTRKFYKKKQDHRFHLSKQTLPLIEINSTELSIPEEPDIKKDEPLDTSRPRLPQRRISERELVAIFENSRQFKPTVSFEKHEYKPSRPQIPRRLLSHEPLRLDRPIDNTPKSRPTIPRKKLTDPPPTSKNIVYVNKTDNANECTPYPATSISFDTPVNSRSSIMKNLTSKFSGNRDLSDLFLKLISDKKLPDKKTAIPEEPFQECSETSTQYPKPSLEKSINVSSNANVNENQPIECFAPVPEEKKLKTLFTMSNSFCQKPSCNSTEPQSQYSMQDEVIMPLHDQKEPRFDATPVKEIKTNVSDKKENLNKRLEYISEIKKIITENEKTEEESEKKLDNKIQKQDNINLEQIRSKFKNYLGKNDLTYKLCDVPAPSNIPKPNNIQITVNTVAEQQSLFKSKIKTALLSKMGNNLFYNTHALNKSASKFLRAQTCPSIKRINSKETKDNQQIENKLEPKISKSTHLPKLATKKSRSNVHVNTVNKLNNLNLNFKNLAESVTGATEVPSDRTLEKKWTVGSIYNSTLLFTKVNKDFNKDSSFKKRKEYYRKLRTKQKKLYSDSSQVNNQKEGKCKEFLLGWYRGITNVQKLTIDTKCPLSKNLYYSRIENFPVRRNFCENKNFSACTCMGVKFEERINKNLAKKKHLSAEPILETNINTIVPVHTFKSESDVLNVVYEQHSSCTSVESGIQSCTTSLAYNNGSASELKCRSEENLNNSLQNNKVPSKAFTVAQCAIPTPIMAMQPNDILTEIINLNQDSLFTNILSINQNCCFNNSNPVDFSKLFNLETSNCNVEDKGNETSYTANNAIKKKKNIWGKMMHLFKTKTERKFKKKLKQIQ